MMKRLLLLTGILMSILFFSPNAFSQKNEQNLSYEVITCSQFNVTQPLREIVLANAKTKEVVREKKESSDRNHRPPQIFLFGPEDGPEFGNDPSSIQTKMGTRQITSSKAAIQNWAGLVATGFRPMDPSGAAGTDYYVQMINSTTYRISNKTTGANVLTGSLGDLWNPATPNAGDPIVMYDKYANRWFLAQFSDGSGADANDIFIAISQTSDPTGAYYTYTFTSPQFPDYLKFSIWENGYYMTSNQTTDRVFCFERDQMLAGNPSARAVSATFSTGSTSNFFVPLPADAGDGGLPPAGTPLPFFSYYDNGWNGGTDGVKIWNMTVTWGATASASISSAIQVNTAAFDAQYNASWNDVSQPGVSQKLDGIGGIPTYRAQWRPWSGYNSVLLNWGVYLSASQRSIKWVELRQDQSTGTWSLYQEGTYTPDSDTRWLGSIAMDNNGSIGMAYAKSSSSTYPSLCYTGRLAGDPLGQMTFAETVVVNGTSSQTGTNRFGDYSHTSLDPADGLTFWHTGEYIASGVKTRVFSFIIPAPSIPPTANFVGTPTTLQAGNTVSFTDLSTEMPTSWSWSFPGGTPSTSTAQNPVITYNTPGTYSVSLTVTNAAGNDTKTSNNYITVTALTDPPIADFVADNTSIVVGSTVNFTDLSTNGPNSWAWTFNGGTPASSTAQNPSIVYNTAGSYDVTLVATNTVGNSTPVTKTSYITVLPGIYCAASATTSDEYLSNVTFGSINNNSGFDGYGDYTSQSTNIELGQSYPISITNAIYYSKDEVIVWIDWNQDADFADAGEQVYFDAGGGVTTNNPYVSIGNITVPATASLGTTRMRVRLHYNTAAYNGNNTPCGDSDFGDVEDYNVVITSASVPPVASYTTDVTSICEGESVQYTSTSTDAQSWAWVFEGGTPATSTAENPLVTYAGPGTFNVSLTVTNPSGSDSQADNNLISVTAAPTVNIGADQTVCSGTSVTLNPGNNPGATYSWSTGETTQVITTITPGTYTLTVTDNGCSASDQAIISNFPDPVVNLGTDITSCIGSTVTLNAQNSGSSYLWSTGATSQTINVTTTNTYSVTVTDGNGCTATDAILVTFDSGLTVDLGGDQTVCNGIPVVLDAQFAGSTYSWSTGASAQTLNITNAGTYTVTVTDAGGCTGTDQATITFNALPVVDLGADQIVCEGTTVTLDAQNTGATFAWSTSESTQSIVVAGTGTYSVDVTDGNGCTGTDQVIITVNPLPVVDLGADINECEGTAVILDAQNTGATYAWSTGANTQMVNATSTGSYSVTVTNNGCSASDLVTVTVNPIPVISMDIVNESNPGACNGSATANPTGNSPFTYNWSTGSTGILNFSPGGTGDCPANSTVTFDLPVSGVGVIDGTGISLETVCMDITHTRLSRITAVNLISPLGTSIMLTGGIGGNLDNYTSTCFNMNGIDGDIALGTPPYTGAFIPMAAFSAFNGENADGTWKLQIVCTGTAGILNSWDLTFNAGNAVTTQGISSLCAGMYTVTVADVNGCTAVANANVGSGSAPVANFSASTNNVCIGSQVDFTDLSTGTPTTWNWVFEGGTPGTSTDQNPVNIQYDAPGAYFVELTVSNIDGSNTLTQAGYITVKNLPIVNAVASANPVCTGSTVVLTGSGASSYSWDNGVTNGSAFIPVDGTTYTVIGTNVDGCSNTASITLNTAALPTVAVSATATEVCSGTLITLSGTGAVSYSWDNGVTDGNAFAPLTSTTYNVTGTDVNGCLNTSFIDITVNALPDVSAIASATSVCEGTSITLSGNGASTYVWDNGVTDGASFVATASSTYNVTGTDANGCSAQASVDITVNTPYSGTASASICEGDSLFLEGSWQTVPGSYTDNFTGSSGCDSIVETTLNVTENPVVMLTLDTIVCAGEIVGLNAGTGQTYSWSTGDNSQQIFVDSSGVGIGTANYFVTVTNGICEDYGQASVTYEICQSIEEIADLFKVTLFPNPTSGAVNLEVISEPCKNLTIEVIDEAGRILSKNTTPSGGRLVLDYGLGNYEAGNYYFRVSNGKTMMVEKVIKY